MSSPAASCRRSVFVGLALLLCLARPATPEEAKPKTLTEWAAETARAHEQDDPEALRRIARAKRPDPWLIVDALCGQGKADAARALAGYAPQKDALLAYAKEPRADDLDRAQRKAFAAAQAAWGARDGKQVLAVLADIGKGRQGVIALRARFLGAMAERATGRSGKYVTQLEAVAADAEKIGWLAYAASAYRRALLGAHPLGKWPTALRLAKGFLRLVIALDDQARVGEAHTHVAIAQLRTGKRPLAEASLAEALKVAGSRGDHRGRGRTLGTWGIQLQRLGDFDAALDAQLRAFQAFETSGDQVSLAQCEYGLGNLHRLLGQFDEALGRLASSRDRWRTLDRVQPRIEAEILIGMVHFEKGDSTRAVETLTAAWDAAKPTRSRGLLIQVRNNLALVEMQLGKYRSARRHLEFCLEARSGSPATRAETLGNLALVLERLGHYRQALEMQEEVLAVRTKLGLKVGMASALNNLGIVRKQLGDYAAAIRDHERALALRRELDLPRKVAQSLHNLATLKIRLGDFEGAKQVQSDALEIHEAHGDEVRVAKAELGLGLIEQELGDLEASRSLYKSTLERYRKLGLDESEVLVNLGVLERVAGDRAKALAYYRKAEVGLASRGRRGEQARILVNIGNVERDTAPAQALETYDRALALLTESPNRDTEARALWGKARALLKLSRPDEAVDQVRTAIQLVTRLSGRLSEGEGAGTRDAFAGLFEIGMQAALAADQPEDLLWLLEQGRAGSLREGLGSRSALEDALLPDRLKEALVTARRHVDATLRAYSKAQQGGKRRGIRKAKQAWEAAQAGLATAERQIEREAKRAAAVTLAEPATLEELQAQLRDDEALVQYGIGHVRSVALVLRRTEIRAIPLPARAELSKTIEALLGDPERHIDASRVSAAQAAWIEPLGLKADVRRVLVSPTGRLGYVPFSLLLPDREIVYVPSGSTYALLRAEVGGPGKGVLAVGDAEYQGVVGAPEGTRRPGPKLTQLPATRQEVESVGTQRLLGADATESKVRAALGRPARWRAVHFACHGLIDPDRPRFSSLALTADAQDDGSWTALEIFRERVDAELVVLSACETGRGRIYRAEGIVGLTRAFMYAGAPRVICSLWKVDDVATRTLMVEFYRRWSEGRSAAAALRDAQRHVRSLEKWKHPYYWAAFVLWGLP